MLDLLGGRSGKRARCTRAAAGADPNPDAGWRFESDALVIASYVVCRGVNGAIDAPSVDLGATVDAESPSGSPRSWRPEIACVDRAVPRRRNSWHADTRWRWGGASPAQRAAQLRG